MDRVLPENDCAIYGISPRHLVTPIIISELFDDMRFIAEDYCVRNGWLYIKPVSDCRSETFSFNIDVIEIICAAIKMSLIVVCGSGV